MGYIWPEEQTYFGVVGALVVFGLIVYFLWVVSNDNSQEDDSE